MLETREFRVRLTLVCIGLMAFGLMLGIEVLTEEDHVTLSDFLGDALEKALLVATAVSCALLAKRMQSQHEEKLSLLRDLDTARAEGEAWRRQAQLHVAGLGAAIESQLELWGLTTAEREIGLLMLKGLTHKEIAVLRGTTDATVRHQAKAIYQKSGVESRTAFCAFFLEDLLPGNGSGATGTAGPASLFATAGSNSQSSTSPRR